MLDVQAIKPQDLEALSAGELAAIATQMLAHIGEQSKRIDSQAQAIKWRDAKIESITFQLARLKAWKFGAKPERGSQAAQDPLAGDRGDHGNERALQRRRARQGRAAESVSIAFAVRSVRAQGKVCGDFWGP